MGAMIDGIPREVVNQTIEAFAPLPALKGSCAATKAIWVNTWLRWIDDCGDRYENRPLEPSGKHLLRFIIKYLFGICKSRFTEFEYRIRRFVTSCRQS